MKLLQFFILIMLVSCNKAISSDNSQEAITAEGIYQHTRPHYDTSFTFNQYSKIYVNEDYIFLYMGESGGFGGILSHPSYSTRINRDTLTIHFPLASSLEVLTDSVSVIYGLFKNSDYSYVNITQDSPTTEFVVLYRIDSTTQNYFDSLLEAFEPYDNFRFIGQANIE